MVTVAALQDLEGWLEEWGRVSEATEVQQQILVIVNETADAGLVF